MDKLWDVFHGWDLDSVVDKAHEAIPTGYEISSFTVQYLNNEYVVATVIQPCGEGKTKLVGDED